MSDAVLQAATYRPVQALIPGRANHGCRACVTIPARNEEATLSACLQALAQQVDLEGKAFPPSSFEILLLLNNCTDRSAQVAWRWRSAHPQVQLYVAERVFDEPEAHAGTARRLLMDTAWQRLGGEEADRCAVILATDGDSIVAFDWLAQNLAAVAAGADAVGGAIHLCAEELETLPAAVRRCYLRDRRYAELVAQLEHLLDPQRGDPWPRHLDHFGSSLACTAAAYARAGGMPATDTLEDEAFVDRLRRADLRLRHEPRVRVFTSARLDGRAKTGLAGQLRLWNGFAGEHEHQVQSAAYLLHRFRTLHRLRHAFTAGSIGGCGWLPREKQDVLLTALNEADSMPALFSAIDCDGLIAETFHGDREEWVTAAIANLEMEIARHSGSPTGAAST